MNVDIQYLNVYGCSALVTNKFTGRLSTVRKDYVHYFEQTTRKIICNLHVQEICRTNTDDSKSDQGKSFSNLG